MIKYGLILLFVVIANNGFAQTNQLDRNVKLYNEKIDELVNLMFKNGFEMYKEQRLAMQNGIDFELNIPLKERSLYSMVFVGDPSTNKIVASLGKSDLGYIFIDRIKPERDKEFWTMFQFPCIQTGTYMFTALQKSELERPLAYFMLFKKTKEAVQN